MLGQATEEECVRIEGNYFHKPEYYEQVLVIEEELISNYVRGKLSPTERSLFEIHFLSSERRRKQYEMTRDLVAYLSESYLPAPNQSSIRRPWRSRFFNPQGSIAIWRIGMMAALLILTFGIVWKSKQPSVSPTDTGSNRSKAPRSEQSDGQQIASSKPNPGPVNALQSQPPNQGSTSTLTQHPQIASPAQAAPRPKRTASIPVFGIDLSGLRTPDEITEVEFPSGVPTIQFDLSLSELDYPSYAIAIKTLDGDLVLRRSQIKPRQTREGQILVLQISTEILRDTVFVLNISGTFESGEAKLLHESFFTVKRQ